MVSYIYLKTLSLYIFFPCSEHEYTIKRNFIIRQLTDEMLKSKSFSPCHLTRRSEMLFIYCSN